MSAADRPECDLLLEGAELVVTMTGDEIPGGWIAIKDGFIQAVGKAGDPPPPAAERVSLNGSLVTPGMICTHNHIYQNLTRDWASDELADGLFAWLKRLNPIWAMLDEEGSYLSTWIACAELALGGCTTVADHLNIHPAPRLTDAQIRAAREIGVRFVAARGSMDLGARHGSITADASTQDIDTILEDCQRLVETYHERTPGAMVQVAFAPCNPFATTTELMKASAELAEKLDVRLHTHLAESPDEQTFCETELGLRPMERFVDCGFLSERTWIAHGVCLNDAELAMMGEHHCGLAHCPTSNILFNQTVGNVLNMQRLGVPVGLGVDGGASAGHASMYHEARLAMLASQLFTGTSRLRARQALEVATLGSAECLGRVGELGVLAPGAAADLVAWPVDGLYFSGTQGDLVEAWLRNGPISARHTICAGRFVVRDGILVAPGVDEIVSRHSAISADWWRRAHPT